MEIEYKVGEKVRITKDLVKLKTISTGYVDSMNRFLGKVVTIFTATNEIFTDKMTFRYTLVEDTSRWNWSSDVFEKLEETEYRQLKDILKTRGI
jgi:hypothetical protein